MIYFGYWYVQEHLQESTDIPYNSLWFNYFVYNFLESNPAEMIGANSLLSYMKHNINKHEIHLSKTFRGPSVMSGACGGEQLLKIEIH